MRYIKFGKYAGTKINGTVPMSIDSNADGIVTHAEQAAWLTAMVESDGMYGSVMNYDGTGLTAGIHQAVALYPRALDARGSLWDLLQDVQLSLLNQKKSYDVGSLKFMSLQEAFIDAGVEFTIDGVLRDREKGLEVKGARLRSILTGNHQGVMPLVGEGRKRSERFVNAFSNLFTSPSTFEAQNQFGMKHFSSWANRDLRFSKTIPKWSIADFIYNRLFECTSLLLADSSKVDPVVNLAMCMFWSHSVNAPGEALKLFCKVADFKACNMIRDKNGITFAQLLIKTLGTATYGRWDDNLKNGRYQRTRKYAMQIFPKDLFTGNNAAMPVHF